MKTLLAGAALFAAGAAVGILGARTRGAADAPARFALQAWEGCRPVDAGGTISGAVTRTLVLADGRRAEVSVVPVRRDNGTPVFDTLVRLGAASMRGQIGAQSMVLSDGLLLRAVDLDAVSRETTGPADYIHRPHAMAR